MFSLFFGSFKYNNKKYKGNNLFGQLHKTMGDEEKKKKQQKVPRVFHYMYVFSLSSFCTINTFSVLQFCLLNNDKKIQLNFVFLLLITLFFFFFFVFFTLFGVNRRRGRVSFVYLFSLCNSIIFSFHFFHSPAVQTM